jgi:DNA-binding XRE family transcriptional regulator
MSLTRKQKIELAKSLYMTGIQQKEIAAKINVSEKTVGNWKEKDNWEMERNALQLTITKELPRILKQFTELNNAIESREEGKRFATSAEIAILREYKNMLLSLDRLPLANVVNVMQSFLNFIKDADHNKAKEISDYADAFVKHIASQKV